MSKKANVKRYIKQDGKTYYMFQAYLGTEIDTGKRIRITRQGFESEEEAIAVHDVLVEEARQSSIKTYKHLMHEDPYVTGGLKVTDTPFRESELYKRSSNENEVSNNDIHS